jgi:hypothetical protein
MFFIAKCLALKIPVSVKALPNQPGVAKLDG